MELTTDKYERITIIRSDLAKAVDELMENVYTPENGMDYSRDQVERALWAWLWDVVETLVEEAPGFSHGMPGGFRTQQFNDALVKAARDEANHV